MTGRFEEAWAAWNGAGAVATGRGRAARWRRSSSPSVRGEAVLCPSNTFMATPLAILAAGGRPVFVDCNRDDLCASLRGLRGQAAPAPAQGRAPRAHRRPRRLRGPRRSRPCAPPRASSSSRTARTRTAPQWHGRRRGRGATPGVYSFYATKTVSTGEGGVLVSASRRRARVRARLSATTASPTTQVAGLNFRMSEFTAALALVQTERMEEIVADKNAIAREHLDPVHPGRLAAARRDGLRPLQVHRLRPHRALDRQGLRRAVPPHHGHGRRPAQQRLGRRAPLVRAALLPPRP